MEALDPKHAAILNEWTTDTYDAMVRAGYIGYEWLPTAAIIERLQTYFHAGLEPHDAAAAIFASHH